MAIALRSARVAFNILDFLDQLEPSNEPGKYRCPACGGNDFTVNGKTQAYNCWHDTSPAHRAEIRDALAPLTRWEKPAREAGNYSFDYHDHHGKKVVVVHRDDTSGNKKIWQDFPTIPKTPNGHKTLLQEVKANILPYRYRDAIEKSKETGLPIFVVEGELTCEAVWALGIPCVTFLGGSKQYRTNGDYSHLFRNEKLVLCPDRDEQGVAFMAEVANDNPGASWLYADPRSWEWDNLPSGNGYDIGDYIEEGATKDDLLSSIVSKSRHQGQDGKPSYEEIISTVEHFVGLYANEARISYETSHWLEQRGLKMSQQNIEKIIDEAKGRVYGKEEIESIDALAIANSDKARDWLIAGIVPLGSVMLLAAAGGTGKALTLSSKILTPTGWKFMGDIQLGDEVIAGDGSITTVTGVFPQGKKPIFRVQMNDGATAHCCDEHLWLTKTQGDRDYGRDWSVRPLKEIRETLHLYKNHGRKDRNHSIPMVGPVQFYEQDLSIHPYLLGVILGDGHISSNNCNITISDPEITRRVSDLLPEGNTLKIHDQGKNCITYGILSNGCEKNVRDALRKLDLWGCRAWEKFVPAQYLHGSVQQRIDLLHGLMDTDGTTDGTSTVFDSSSKALRDAVVFIVQSLGGKVSCSERQPWFTYQGEKKQGRIGYRAFISMPPGFKSFSIEAKASKEIERTKYVPSRLIDSIEYIGEDEAQCIMVDHPSHTYVTDDFIVTHNTTLLYNWALHVALGQQWSGRRCMKGTCLLISADEPLVDTAEKLSVIGYQDAGLKQGDISFWETWRFTHMKQLEDYIRKERPSLVMIDSLTSCLAGMSVDLARSNAGDAIYGLRDMANTYRCSIVILHHLNKSGGLRDSTSFVDNVSEVVKLTKSDGFDPDEFSLEWMKSRSGLTGKHVLKRDSLNYGWHYAGPVGGSLEELNQVVNVVNMRKTERFTKQQVAMLSGSFETSSTGKMLEVARRQGLITSSFQDSPDGTKIRLYHSWEWEEPKLDFPSIENHPSNESNHPSNESNHPSNESNHLPNESNDSVFNSTPTIESAEDSSYLDIF
jgi:hypothetical protein